MPTRLILAIATVTVLISACASDPARPSQGELAKVFASQSSPFGMPLPTKQAECVADAYTDSGLSTGYLTALRTGKTPRNVSEHDRDKLNKISEKINDDCLS